jgi:hypothetical protein
MEILRKLFGSDGFMPHGMCYLWNTRLIYLHASAPAQQQAPVGAFLDK